MIGTREKLCEEPLYCGEEAEKALSSITSQILAKFDKLLDKEDYYNYQERIYKINKAMCSVVKSQDLHVTSFQSSEHSPKHRNSELDNTHSCSNTLKKIDISPANLLKMLDELLIEKESLIISTDNILNTSSSEEEKLTDYENFKEITFTKKKKKLIKYIYNYELAFKTSVFEDNLKNEQEVDCKNDAKLYDELGINMSTFSNFSTNNKLNTNESLSGTPLSMMKSSRNDNASVLSKLNGTPTIKKSFFEDKEIKMSLNKRRRSLLDQRRSGLGANPNINEQRRKSDFVNRAFKFSCSESKSPKKNADMLLDDSDISRFDFNLILEDNEPNLVFENTHQYEKRSSIFKDRDIYLTHIAEHEEDMNNSEESEVQSEEDEKKCN